MTHPATATQSVEASASAPPRSSAVPTVVGKENPLNRVLGPLSAKLERKSVFGTNGLVCKVFKQSLIVSTEIEQ